VAKFRRYYVDNALVFIVSVTHDCAPIFADDHDADLLFVTMREVQKIHPFNLLASAVLPDHVHFLMRTGSTVTFSQVMQSIKWNFTRNYKRVKSITEPVSLWQDRFWDHVIRDETDLSNHIDYIHYNPVKHGYVDAPAKWQRSSFTFRAERGYYAPGWGTTEPPEITGLNLE
jgi:putative transposase